MPAFTFASMGAFCHVLPLAGSVAPRHSDAAKEGVPMADRKLTEAQRAYEAKRAAKAGMSLEKWLTEKEKRAAAEAKAMAEAASVNYNFCPDGFGEYSGKEWAVLDSDVLASAAASDALAGEYREIIGMILQGRAELEGVK
jgi:hypothetical protein